MTDRIDEPEIDADLVDDDQTDDIEDTTPEPDPDREQLEAQARKYGWRPQSEFDRAPASWVDADRFLELPATNVKVLRDEMKQRDEDYKRQIEEVTRGTKMAVERVRAQEQQRYEADLAAIRAAKREAVDMADVKAYEAAEQREQALKAPDAQAQPTQPDGPQVDPYVQEYASANDWLKNPILFDTAKRLIDANPAALQMGAKDQLAYAETEIKRMYPGYFPAQQQAPARASRVDSGGLGTGRRQGKGADDLPADVRRVAKEFVQEGVYKSVDEYAADYFAQEATR
ncbi:hypothetical protein [Loktanella sp. R86503]|uniref:hypothetical protein n=1 Tax=Loktanella sp. R86503 TaxID=3093847 RepID=UPI0036DB5970